MKESLPPVAVYYSAAAFTETTAARQPAAGRPQGLVGREVASRAFLEALLPFKRSDATTFVLESEMDRRSATELCDRAFRSSPRPQRVRIVPPADRAGWVEQTPGGVLMFASPPLDRLAYERAATRPHSFALCGVTHTLATPAAILALRKLVAAPLQPYDSLVCTSAAVMRSAQVILDSWRDSWAESGARVAGENLVLKHIPLGVDMGTHRPATARERAEARRRLGIPDDHFALLFVGRLSHHSKAQPFPMLVAAQAAAETTGRQIVLLMSGWFANEAVRRAFSHGAATFAPNVQTIFINGVDPDWRFHVWDAADCFVSLADSVQETFGLTPLEALSRRLPVMVSDWDGYRETIVDGQTGLTVPTAMCVSGNQDAADRLIRGEINYDRFLAELGQRTIVDVEAAARQLIRLVRDPSLCRRLAEAGYRSVQERFAWPKIIAQYETLWAANERLRGRLQAEQQSAPRQVSIPSATADATAGRRDAEVTAYPDIRQMYSGYPSRWLDGSVRLRAGGTPLDLLSSVAAHGLTGHCSHARLTDPAQLRSLAENAERRTLDQLVEDGAGDAGEPCLIATVLWLLKYGFLATEAAEDAATRHRDQPLISFVTTCMGRLEDLRNTLPRMAAQPHSEVVLVDYSCPQRSGAWARANVPRVRVVEIPGQTTFHRSTAKNAGIDHARGEYICLIDADILLAENFVDEICRLLAPDKIIRRENVNEGVGGTFIAPADAMRKVGGHDVLYEGWGEEDDDLAQALRFLGLKQERFRSDLITHRMHGDDERTRFHEVRDRRHSHMINRIYRAAKWDLANIRGSVPEQDELRRLYASVKQTVVEWIDHGGAGEVVVNAGTMMWTPLSAKCARRIRYSLVSDPETAPGEYERDL